MISEHKEPIENTPIHTALCARPTIPATTNPKLNNNSNRIDTAIEKGQVIKYQKVNNGYYLLLGSANEEIPEKAFDDYFTQISDIKGELIKSKLWDFQDPRDPSTDEEALKILTKTVTDRFGMIFISFGFMNAGPVEVSLAHDSDDFVLASEGTEGLAIAMAALRLTNRELETDEE